MTYLKRIAYPFVLTVALCVLLVEVPAREIARAWRNLRVVAELRRQLATWASYWRTFP